MGDKTPERPAKRQRKVEPEISPIHGTPQGMLGSLPGTPVASAAAAPAAAAAAPPPSPAPGADAGAGGMPEVGGPSTLTNTSMAGKGRRSRRSKKTRSRRAKKTRRHTRRSRR